MIKGEFLVVEYLGWEHSYREIVPAERLRLKNINPPITATTFHKFEVEVPEELRVLYVSSMHRFPHRLRVHAPKLLTNCFLCSFLCAL